MPSSLTHTKNSLLIGTIVLVVAFFAVFVPTHTVRAATEPFCAHVANGPLSFCSATLEACNRAIAPTQQFTKLTCFDTRTPSAQLDPSEQRAITISAEIAKRDAATAQASRDDLFFWAVGPLKVIPMLLAGIASVVFKIAGLFIVYMAKIMDWSISVSIDSQLLGSMQFVDIGWTAVRDLSNMFFIFALLYIAIQTILGLSGGGAKRWLVHIIIAALLINFSLFMTKVVIDAGNVLAVSFWNKMQTQQGTLNGPAASPKILGGLDLQTVFSKNSNMSLLKPTAVGGYSYGKIFLAYSGGAIFMFIAGYIFLAAALMMITRTIMLLLLMIFSPFAFMSFGLPKLEQYGHQWLDKLVKQTFVAPVFIFMLYLNSVLVDKLDIFKLSGSKGQDFATAFAGGGDYQIIFNFMMMIGFLIASLAIANSVAGDVGSSARGWAKSASKWAGGMAVGGAVGTSAWALRQGLGTVGMRNKDQQALHDAAARGGVGGAIARGKIAMYTGMTKATYDPRATKMGQKALSGFGNIDIGSAGGAGGYAATGSGISKVTLGSYGYTGSDADKIVLARAEERYKNDPAGKAAYLRANLGSKSALGSDGKLAGETALEKMKSFVVGNSSYDTAPGHKELRDKVAREAITKEHKENLKKNIAAAEAARKDGREVGEELIKGITDAMKGLTSRELGEMLPQYAHNDEFMGNLSMQDVHAINQMEREGKYVNAPMYTSKDATGNTLKDAAGKDIEVNLMDRVAQGVLRGNNQAAKEYMASPEGQQRLFNVPIEKYKSDVEVVNQLKDARERSKDRIADMSAAEDMANVENAARVASAARARTAEDTARAASAVDDVRSKMRETRERNKR